MMNVRRKKFKRMPRKKTAQEKDFFAFENRHSAMTKKKASAQKIKLVCPVCGAEGYDSILKKTLSRNTTTDRESLGNIQHWACDNCLACGKAIPANPGATAILRLRSLPGIF